MSRFFRKNVGGSASASASDGTLTPEVQRQQQLSLNGSSSSRTSSRRPSTEAKAGRDLSGTTPHPLLRPHPDVKIPAQEPLTAEQLEIVARLRAHMESMIRSHYEGKPQSVTSASADASPPVEPFYEKWEYRWLNAEGDDTTLKRYLRAAKGNEQEAIRRLESTLHWRRSFKPDIIAPEDVRVEGETGKHILCGFDNAGRPILYLIPRRENTKSSERQIRYVVWGLERTIDLLPPGQSKVTLAIDFQGSTQASNPNMATSRRVLSILQNHYVERLGSALIIRPPWYMNAFYTAITPFIDPMTKEKVKWNTDLTGYVPPSHLLKEYGGEYDFAFDKEVTWNDILDFTGVAPDGTRVHESFAKVTEEQEKEWRRRQGEGGGVDVRGEMAPPAQAQAPTPNVIGNGEANGNGKPIAAPADDEDEEDEDAASSSPQFHDAREVLSRSSTSAQAVA